MTLGTSRGTTTSTGASAAAPGDVVGQVVGEVVPTIHGHGSIALTILASLALLYSVHFARPFLAPIVLAGMLHLLLVPIVRKLGAMGVSKTLAAALLLLGVVSAVAAGVWRLSGPAMEWVEEIPIALRRADERVATLRAPVETIAEAAQQVESLTKIEGAAEPIEVEQAATSAEMVGGTGSLISGAAVTAFLLFFMLSNSGSSLRLLVRLLPRFGDKRLAVSIFRSTEREITRYLGTIALVNLALGVGVGLWTFALGLPTPVLWGVLAGTLNFVPYAGTAVGVAVLGLVAFVSVESLSTALLAPSGYLVLSGFEGMVVTPSVLGSRLRLRPVVVLIWLLGWGFLWGILGVLLAVPLLVVTKILCDHIPRMKPIGLILARGDG